MFRKLTDEELAVIEKAARRSDVLLDSDWMKRVKKGGKVAYVAQGNFTAAIILGGKDICVGVAKRNPGEDANVPERANILALSRAVKNEEIPIGA